jgi:hypothetical protein
MPGRSACAVPPKRKARTSGLQWRHARLPKRHRRRRQRRWTRTHPDSDAACRRSRVGSFLGQTASRARAVAIRNNTALRAACPAFSPSLFVLAHPPDLFPAVHPAHNGWRRARRAQVRWQGLRQRRQPAAVPKLPEAGQRELLLLARLLQAQLGTSKTRAGARPALLTRRAGGAQKVAQVAK